jgi:hypothetical protein
MFSYNHKSVFIAKKSLSRCWRSALLIRPRKPDADARSSYRWRLIGLNGWETDAFRAIALNNARGLELIAQKSRPRTNIRDRQC